MKPKPNTKLLCENRKCIINTDLDGILSGLVLHNVLNWQIVGFCDSNEFIWIDISENSLKEAIFIDMFVTPDQLKCIDQHIVSYDIQSARKLSQNHNKLNPNLINYRYFTPSSSYSKKYPFGTLHFIISCLEGLGYELKLELNKEIIYGLCLIDFILRTDDTYKTSTFSNYTENAEEWWNWLLEYSKNGKITKQFYDHIKWTKVNLWKRQVELQKQKISNLLLSSPFYCSSSDGGYTGSHLMGKTKLKKHVKDYIMFLSEITGYKCFNLKLQLKTIKGESKRAKYSNDLLKKILALEESILFSYAFVRSNNRENNFSYTLMSKKTLSPFCQ